MSNVDKRKSEIVSNLYSLVSYYQGTGEPVHDLKMGAELETPYFKIIDGQPVMMSPQESAAILQKYVDGGDKASYEVEGVRQEEFIEGASLVAAEGVTGCKQLELCGVLENSTQAFSRQRLAHLLAHENQSFQRQQELAASIGLRMCPFSYLPTATLEDCDQNVVPRERLISEWNKFMSIPNHPGQKTMGLSCSSQVSVSYTDLDMLKQIYMRAAYLSPLFYALSANAPGFIGGEKVSKGAYSPRAAWWAEHNQHSERAALPPFLREDLEAGEVIERWMKYASSAEMIFYFGENGEPVFSDNRSFSDFMTEDSDLATKTNYELAESLMWPDVKICNSPQGKRIESRAWDGGSWQNIANIIVSAAVFLDEDAGRKVDQLIANIGVAKDELFDARLAVADQGLQTAFGSGRLKDMTLPLFRIVEQSLGNQIPQDYLQGLKYVCETGNTDSLVAQEIIRTKEDLVDFLKLVPDSAFKKRMPLGWLRENGYLEAYLNRESAKSNLSVVANRSTLLTK